MEATMAAKLWTSIALIGCALGTVTLFTIRGGPSANEAILALRIAHRELFWARNTFRDPVLLEVESHLNLAWSALQERQYDESISAANQSLQRVREITSGVPWFYSRSWHGMEPHDARGRDS